MHDSNDLDDLVSQDPVHDGVGKAMDEVTVHTKFLGNRRHERPTKGMFDDVVDGFVDGEYEPRTETIAFLLVATCSCPQFDAGGSEDPVMSTGHAAGLVLARPTARRGFLPTVRNRSGWRRQP